MFGSLAVPWMTLFGVLARYGKGTLANYDARAGTEVDLTPELIKATRSPWMGSRISFAQERQLIQRWSSGVATWSRRFLPDARLVDADPAITGGLYDLTEDLYTHFRTPRILFVGSAKISKSLHLMRPHLIPVLDSKLMRLYKQPAQAAATRLAQLRPERFAGRRRCYWAAVSKTCSSTQTA